MSLGQRMYMTSAFASLYLPPSLPQASTLNQSSIPLLNVYLIPFGDIKLVILMGESSLTVFLCPSDSFYFSSKLRRRIFSLFPFPSIFLFLGLSFTVNSVGHLNVSLEEVGRWGGKWKPLKTDWCSHQWPQKVIAQSRTKMGNRLCTI